VALEELRGKPDLYRELEEERAVGSLRKENLAMPEKGYWVGGLAERGRTPYLREQDTGSSSHTKTKKGVARQRPAQKGDMELR